MKKLQSGFFGWPIILALMLFSIVVNTQAQTNRFHSTPSLIPIFTNNPAALLVISNLLAEPQPPLSVPVVSHTNTSSGGVYWALTSPGPLPFNPYSGLDVYQVSSNSYIIDDRSVDYAELDAENASNNPVTFQPQGLTIDTNGLYIAVPTNSLATPNFFTVNVVNTIIGQSYDILTASDLLLPSWMTALTTNAVSNITQVQVPRISAKLFVRARESTGASFYINESPLNQTVEDGDSVTFSVATGGNPNLTYQWTFNGVAIAGATNSSYTLKNVANGDGGQYAVTVSDGTNPQTASAQLTTDSADPFGYTTTGNANLIPILSSRQDYTFKSGNTYYISAVNSFYGQTTIEGGTVIKPDWYYGGSVQIMGTLTCNTEPYYPAIFTSVDDDSVGEVLGFSQQDGAPFPANNGLAFLDLTYVQSNAVVSNVQMKFADLGVTTPSAGLDVWDSQFYECDYAIVNFVNGGTNNLHNVLFADCNDAVRASTNAITINGEQVTADVTRFCQSTTTPTRIALTNSLYFGTTASASSLSTVNVTRNPNGTNFAAEGYGNYYLAANSPLHNAGSAIISPRLQNELQHKTTYAPVAIAVNTSISGNLTISPQAQRYTNGAPDIGYYYDALDYTVANLTLAGGNLTVLPNTAIAMRNEFITSNSTYTVEGFFVQQGSIFTSHGTPTKPNIFTAEKLVQETPETGFAGYKNTNGWWFGGIAFVTDSEPDAQGSPAATYDFRFSKFYLPPSDYHFWSGYDEYGNYALEVSPDSSMYLNLQDCQFHGGRINLGNPDQSSYTPTQVYPAGALSWINNSFANTAISLDPTYYRANGVINCDMQLLAYNNLFQSGSWLLLEPFPASAGHWTFRDNLFDKVNFLQDASQPLDFDHNGYWPLLAREFLHSGSAGELTASTGGTDGGNEVTLSNAPPYAAGAFGNFYLSTVTALYQAGSRTAGAAGLTQYTTFISQAKDASGSAVDIGLHYVAAMNNAPLDTDGDGIPDYVEDANGNGVVDANETSPNLAMTDGVAPDVSSGVYDDIDLSGDGLVGRIKKQLGMNPLDSSNPLTLHQVIFGGEPDVTTFEIPVSYSTMTNIGTVHLMLNGVPAVFDNLAPATDGNTLLVWSAVYDPPQKTYDMQARLALNGVGDDSAILTGVGTLLPFYYNNDLQYFQSDGYFDTNGAYLDAQLPASYAGQNVSYTIQVFDPSTTPETLVKGITNSSSNGMIQEDWNLTYDDGVTVFTGTNADVVYAIVDPSTSSGVNPNVPSSKKHHRPTPQQNITETVGAHDGFDFCYMYTPTTGAMQPEFDSDLGGDDGAVWLGLQNAVNNLISPPTEGNGGNSDFYTSGFNHYTSEGNNNHGNGTSEGFPGYIGSMNDLTNSAYGLFLDMTNGLTKNFFCYAHGNDGVMASYAPSNQTPNVYISANGSFGVGGVANMLGNYSANGGNTNGMPGLLSVHNPYRFVFMDGCGTASGWQWRSAFGIYPLYLASQSAARYKLGPQAYVGWADSFSGWFNESDDSNNSIALAQAYANTLNNFYEQWMLNVPLAQCIDIASRPNISGQAPFPVPKNGRNYHFQGTATIHGFPVPYNFVSTNNETSKIYIIGHPGLTRSGLNQPADNNTSYAAPVNIQ